MGTRNLTIVISGGTHKIAQYGQWDGYPNGQGVTALEFCRLHLSTKEGRESFAKILDRVRFVSEEEHKALWAELYQKYPNVRRSSMDGFVTLEESHLFNQEWPYFSRDNGAKILDMVAKSKSNEEILTSDSYSFAGDSLSNEWTYVIDLDAGTFEVFKGFNTKFTPVAGERFAAVPPYTSYGGTVYYPVRLVKKWDLHGLPTKAEFLASFEDADEDAAEE